MVKLSFAKDKYEKRSKAFSSVMTDMKIEDNVNGEPVLTMEFGDDLPLTVKLGYEKWQLIEQLGQKSPKPGTPIYKLLRSIDEAGYEIELDVDNKQISTNPSILGKECTFAVQEKSFKSKDEVDESGDFRTIKFYIWTLTKTSVQSTLTLVKQPDPVTTTEFDMAVVRKSWLEIVNSLPAKFTYPQMIQGKGKWLQGKQFSKEEDVYYTTAVEIKAQFSALIEEGYVQQNGNDYFKVQDMIDLGLKTQ